MQTFVNFYKNFGIRTETVFKNPVPHPVRQLCRGAILHLPTEDGRDFPDESMPFLNKLANRIFLYNELNLIEENHATSSQRLPKDSMIREWVQKHKKQFAATFKPVGAIDDENILIAYNYGLADNGYRYSESVKMTPYFRWQDNQKTMWKRIAELASTTSRQNFVVMKTGLEIPSPSALRTAVKGFGTTQLAFFDDDTKRNILDLWTWIDPETRENSTLSFLKVTDLPRVNLLFQMFNGASVILNLGYLNSWIKSDGKNQPNQTDSSSVSTHEAGVIQADFLRFLIALQTYNIEGERAARESETAAEDDRQNVPDGGESIDDEGGEGLAPDFANSSSKTNQGIPSSIPSGGLEGSPGSRKDILAAAAAAIGKDLTTERVKTEEEEQQQVEEELRALEEMEERRVKARGLLVEEERYDPEEGPSAEELQAQISAPPAFGENITRTLDRLVDRGAISAAEFRKITKSLEAFKNLPDPFTGKGNILEAATVKHEDLQFNKERVELVDPTGIASESNKSTVVEELDRSYINKVFKKEILASVLSVTNLDTLIDDLSVDVMETAEGKFVEMSMVLRPIGGKPSIIRHRFPFPYEDGTFKAKGVRYHSRKQINDVNFRKIQGNVVGLSTYTSKLFLNRSTARAHNTTEYIKKFLVGSQLGEITHISRLRQANVYDRNFKAPYIYSTLSENYKGFTVENKLFGNIVFDFESRKRDSILTEDVRTSIEKQGNVLCGKTKDGLPVFVGPDDIFHVRTKNGDVEIGDIYKVLDLDQSKAPVEFAEMSLLGATVPIGLVMGRLMGFRNLLKLTQVKYKMFETRSVPLEPWEFKVRFKDRTFVFDKRDRLASLIFGGFTRVADEMKNYPAISFDSSEVYDVMLENQNLTPMHLREIDNLDKGFIDPISLRRLKSQKGPLTFKAMLLQGCRDLTHNNAPDTQDADYQQILGYERFAAAIHREVYSAYRSFRNTNSTGRGKINMSHFAVWQSIMEDGTIKTCEDINPVQNTKMHEALTFAGNGGRSRETFNMPARSFHIRAAGLHSEASVDSGDVAYNVFLPWNPLITDLNGKRQEGESKLGYGNLLSTSLNLVAGPNHNDMKRNAFTSIQNTHTIACQGYEAPLVQTGNETLISQRVDDLFCKVAKRDGKIISVTERGVIVEYDDKTREGVEIGRRYGDAEGTTYPHDIVTNLKVGDKVKKGETIAYNTGFFEPSALNPKFSIMKFGVYGNVAFMDIPETHEDSCSISPEFAEKLGTKTTDPRSYVLRFTQSVHEVMKPGTVTTPDSVLMVIEDEVTSNTDIYDPKSISTFSRLNRDAPRAGHTGVLDEIEVHYHGDKADMSPTIRKLVDASDRKRSEVAKSTDKQTISGRVTSDWSVKGNPLQLDHVEITFKVTANYQMANADKIVFGEQLKATVGKVEMRKMFTESGRPIHAVFGGKPVIKRIVLTAPNVGSSTFLLEAGEKEALQAYFG